jgi:citrate lyase subunit beta/citryl-CoA lyase
VAARRSCLSVPGSRPRFQEKADASAVDMVILDLEDSVAPAAKEEAREQVVQALRRYRYEGKVRGVRVNSVDTRWCADDVRHVVEGAGDRLDCLVIPKVEDVDMVHFVHHLLNQLELKLGLARRIGLELQVESALGLENAFAVASASPRSETLVLGPVDLAADMGMPGGAVSGASVGHPGEVWHYFLARVAVAARAAGLQAIDGPFTEVRDLDGLRTSARRAAALGYDGKWVIHPDQAEVVNQVFSPSLEAFEHAYRVVEAYRRATEVDGTGAVMLDAEMIDEASRKHAVATLERGRASGMTVPA